VVVDDAPENDATRHAQMTTPQQQSTDHGPEPFVIDIEQATTANENYRAALWTGTHLQLTVMNIEPGGEIGLEVHPDRDQFLRLESGRARVQMGDTEDDLDFDTQVQDDWVILVPAGKWHNVTNIDEEPLKLYSLYAPPEHPHGTIHGTRAEAEAAEHH
jgi:mannose-6-phosphate isomerase-like protein (cupin superfamily)